MSLSRQASIYASFSALNVIISYGLLLFIANVMSKQGYADFGFYSSLMSLLLIAVNCGYKETFFKWASQGQLSYLDKLRDSFYPWLLFFVVLATITLFFSPEAGLAGLGFISLYALTAVSGLNRGFEYYLKDAIAIPTYRTFWLVGCIVIWWLWGQLPVEGVFFAALIGSVAATMLVTTPPVKKTLNFAAVRLERFSLPWMSPTMRHFFLVELATVAYIRVDMLFLKGFDVESDAMAEYYLGIQVLDAALMIIAPISYLFFNQINRSLRRWYQDAVPYVALMTAIVFAIIAGWWLIGEWILAVMFPQYVGSYTIALALLAVLIPGAGTLILSHVLFHWDDEWIYVKACFAGLFICLLSQSLLIPAYAEWGAITARLVTESVIFLALVGVVLYKTSRQAR
ncbi:hypothetical protein LG288_02755 [Idiomarina seosinensis]|uniref:lipopolysaccharide biosynthesis protein n=1 Tax=Idiomarina seosinensis TaxID=281739 RepID=UPI00384EA2F5